MVNAYPLIKGTLWVKYEPDWRKGRGNMLQTWIFHIVLLRPSHLTLKCMSPFPSDAQILSIDEIKHG